jgi:hypothetical protein
MMFFDGYIGAPPTVTVFSSFICAKVGVAAIVLSVSAAARAVKVVMRESFMSSSSDLKVAPAIGVTFQLREVAVKGCKQSNFSFTGGLNKVVVPDAQYCAGDWRAGLTPTPRPRRGCITSW